jgi:hypothetical protein
MDLGDKFEIHSDVEIPLNKLIKIKDHDDLSEKLNL